MAADDVTEKASSTPKDLSLQNTAIVILSPDYGVLSCSHGVENLTGYTLEALSHLKLWEIFEPAETLNEVLQRVQAGESPPGVRIRLRAADGRHLPADVHCGPLQSLHSSKAGIVLIIRAVAPQEVRRPQEVRLALLGQLAGEVSHEIRNPMNAIFLHADIVEEDLQHTALGDCTQVTQSLATIKAELTRLHGLMQDYLFLARLSDLQRAPTDLRAIVEDLVYDMHPQCALRGVAFVLGELNDLGEVALHESSFRRALLNILQLLIEAVPREATLTLSGVRTGCHVQLQVHDLSKAIPPEGWVAFQMSLRANIPDPADLRTFVARETIRAHGGEIAVSDDAKTGLLCTISLPLDTMG